MAPVSPQNDGSTKHSNRTTNKNKNTNSYQELLSNAIGDFGRWQIYLIFAHFTPKIVIAWSMIIISFGGAKTDWWRETPEMDPISKCFLFNVFFKFKQSRALYDQSVFSLHQSRFDVQ